MDEIESLCRLCEAVETAGADIAPTYAEYVQLAFAMEMSIWALHSILLKGRV